MRSQKECCWAVPLQALVVLFSGTLAEASDASSLCTVAAREAAERYSIPTHLLQTLTMTETGRSQGGAMRPWPWAINHRGQSHWFATEAEMIQFAERLIAAGDANFDIGCFQLNYRWHGQHFASIAAMAGPARNADYAASFLRTNYASSGSWRDAVGAYHSRTPTYANAYLARFEAVFAEWSGSDLPEQTALQPEQDKPEQDRPEQDRPEQDRPEHLANTFPLLMTGAMGQGASLVPMLAARGRLIGGTE